MKLAAWEIVTHAGSSLPQIGRLWGCLWRKRNPQVVAVYWRRPAQSVQRKGSPSRIPEWGTPTKQQEPRRRLGTFPTDAPRVYCCTAHDRERCIHSRRPASSVFKSVHCSFCESYQTLESFYKSCFYHVFTCSTSFVLRGYWYYKARARGFIKGQWLCSAPLQWKLMEFALTKFPTCIKKNPARAELLFGWSWKEVDAKPIMHSSF